MAFRSSVFFLITTLIAGSFEVRADPHLSSNHHTSNFPFQIEYVHSGYEDDEIRELWSSLSDIDNPTLDDFLKVENYLKYGRRPYLDLMFNQGVKSGFGYHNWKPTDQLDRSMAYASRILQRFMLVGPNGEMPHQGVIALGGVPKDDLTRCIVLYASYNYDAVFGDKLYAEKMHVIIHDLEELGYKGHVLYRTGGYPMLDRGGLFLAHVPYSFKVLSLIEASLKGYQEVLWIDTSLRPTNDLTELFNEIKNRGIYIVYNGINFDYDYDFGIIPDETALLHKCPDGHSCKFKAVSPL